MAREFHAEVSDVTLTRYSHKKFDRTTSPPGEPPAVVSGALKRSLRLYAATRVGAASAESKVVPLIKYARIQETGGTIHAKGGGYLHWKSNAAFGPLVKGQKRKKNDHYAKKVTLPPRPYMAPTHRKMVSDGSLHNAAVKELKLVIQEVLHG